MQKKVKQLEKEIEELKKPKYLVHFENNKITKIELINDYISKDKIREIFQFYIERDSLFNDDTHKMAVIRLKDVLKELLEEK